MINWRDRISQAEQAISPYIRKTTALTLDLPDIAQPVSLKFENMQHTGSFKTRGAFNTLLSSDVPAAGVVAASGGNHGAAVAYAARTLGHPARIFVPEISNPAKIALIRGTGADLVIIPGSYADALARARSYEAGAGALQIHAYDAPETVAGQGTCFAEWQAQGLEADTLLIAVGGGGLISGAMGWFGTAKRYIGVETLGCPALCEALNIGEQTDVDVSGCAADALGARRIGDICFGLAQTHDLRSILVSDANVRAAQVYLWKTLRQLVEPAGAVALAAVLSGAYVPGPEEKLAILVCGGNIAPDPMP